MKLKLSSSLANFEYKITNGHKEMKLDEKEVRFMCEKDLETRIKKYFILP